MTASLTHCTRARLLFALVALAFSTAAAACQCDDTSRLTPNEIEQRAQWISSRSFVIAEVERLPAASPADERYRVVKLLAGTAPEIIRVDRFITRLANGQVLAAPVTSCDYSAPVGFRRVMAFSRGGPFPAPPCGVLAFANAAEAMRPASMCTQSDLDHPMILKRVLELQSR